MTSSAYIAHVLDPLIDPQFAEQDLLLHKQAENSDDQISRDHLRNFKKWSLYSLDWSGDKLLISTKEYGIRLWDAEKDLEERSWSGDWMMARCDPSNPNVAAAVSWSGGKFKVLDMRSSQNTVGQLDCGKQNPMMKEFLELTWSPDSKYIATNTKHDQVFLIDMRMPGAPRLGKSQSFHNELNQMVWSPDGETLWIANGGTPGKIHVYPTPSLQSESATALTAHAYTAISLAADPTGRYIASGGGDCLVTLWDPKHLICTRTFGNATQAVTTLGFNHTGSLLAWGTGATGSSGGEKNITFVGANTGALYFQEGTCASVQQLQWHRKRNWLAYSVNVSQLDDSSHRRSSRDQAVVHIMRLPE